MLAKSEFDEDFAESQMDFTNFAQGLKTKYLFTRGRVAKLVDALDLGSCEEARGGSIPFTPILKAKS